MGGKRSNTLVAGVRRSTRPHKGATRDVSLVRHVVGKSEHVFDGLFRNALMGKKWKGCLRRRVCPEVRPLIC